MILFVAIRYLLTHVRQTLVCIAGVIISVTMFIAMTAMMSGFTEKFIIETVESSGHLTIHDEPREATTPILEQAVPDVHAVRVMHGVKPREKVEKIKNAQGLLAMLRRLPYVVEAAPLVKGDVIATYGTKTYNLNIFGVDPDKQIRVTTIGENVVEGSLGRLKSTANGIVIGRGIAQVLGAQVNDNVTLASPTGGQTTAKIVGIFDTGVTPVDFSRAYMLLPDAQTLLDKKNIINEIIARTTDYTQAREYAAQIEGVVGYKVESWQEASANFLKIFAINEIMTYVITGAILIVAAFGVLNILIMAVMERINDIAILRSFGLSRNDITLIYMTQGVVIGCIGAVAGLGVGKIAIELLRRVPVQAEGLIRAEGLLMSEHTHHYVSALIAAIVVTIVASVYPARRAAKYDPVEVIRGAH